MKHQQVKDAFKEIPWLRTPTIVGTLGKIDLYIMTTGPIIWIKSLILPNQDSTMTATIYQAIFFLISFLMTGVMTFKVDKIFHMKLAFPILIFATLGYLSILFVHYAQSLMLYVFFVPEELTLLELLVLSTYLSIRYNPPEIRGTICW